MTRRQAENLAKGNPRIKARLDAGEFDDSSRAGPGGSPGSSRSAPKRTAVRAGGSPRRSPANPRAASGSPGSKPDETPPPRRGLLREFGRGLFDL
jgi:hypothetical protein